MTEKPPVQPGIMDISLYVGGASSVEGQSNIVKLSANETPWGPPEGARAAAERALFEMHRYPSGDHLPLREAIGKVWSLDPAQIICASGSGDILTMICNAYSGPGQEVISTEHGFALYKICAQAAGATPVIVPEAERVTDIHAILNAVTERTSIVFLANPNNPTGTMIGVSDLRYLAGELSPNIMLVIDGAYAEYVEGYDGGAHLCAERENVVITRTFSKIYGLASLRVGWAYGPQSVIDVLNRIRGPFNVSAPALAAAEAAVQDEAFLEKTRADTVRLRDWLAGALMEHGIPSDHSMANFILARFTSPQEAAAADAHLRGEGILVRRMDGYNLPHCLRITVGDEPSCRRVAHAIGQFKQAQT